MLTDITKKTNEKHILFFLLAIKLQLNRLYSESQSRNNNNFIQINPRLYDKNFTLTRNYNASLPLTNSITISYMANVQARIQEPFGAINTKEKQDSIYSEFKGFGRIWIGFMARVFDMDWSHNDVVPLV